MATRLHDLLTRISTWAGHHPYQAAAGFFFILGILLLWAPARPASTARSAARVQLSPVEPADFEHALVQRYEKRFDALQGQVTEQRAQLDAHITELRKANQELQQSIEHNLATLPPEPHSPAAG